MNLATGCSSCGTLFRVVQDQLKVSDGWVRCGHCHAVFNALESLVDLDHDPLPVAMAAATTTSDEPAPDAGLLPPQPPASVPTEPVSPASVEVASPAADDHDLVLTGSPTFIPPAPARRDPEVDLDLVLPAAAEPPRGQPVETDSISAVPVAAPPSSVLEAPLPAAFSAERPSFARALERKHGGRRRTAWLGTVAALLLVALLAGQWLHRERAMLVARFPATRQAFEHWCATAGCRIALPQAIDDLSVESTGLAPSTSPGAFRLTVGLRNRGPMSLALPAVELSLSDTAGQLIARKVLVPADFDKPPASLQAGGDALLQALVATPGGSVSGYTVEVFYP